MLSSGTVSRRVSWLDKQVGGSAMFEFMALVEPPVPRGSDTDDGA
jgi:hypothetical protein